MTVDGRFRVTRDHEPTSTYVHEPRILHPLENEEIKILLLENISQDAVAYFRRQAYHVDHHLKAMSEDELIEKIGAYHVIGIRSKTHITERVLQSASKVRSRVVCPST
jgi:D-3-phosphoglycerate dehydrogenase